MGTHQFAGGNPSTRNLMRLIAVLAAITCVASVVIQKQRLADAIAEYEVCKTAVPDPYAAIQACDELISEWPLNDDNLALVYRDRSRAHLRLKDWSNALQDADRAIDVVPGNVTSWALKSHVLVRMEDHQAAYEIIETALSLAPDDDYSQRMKLELLIHMERIGDARVMIGQLMLDYPDRYWVPRQLGRLQLREDDFRSAALSFAVALKMRPQDKYSRRKFFSACRSAGDDCPRLFPKAQAEHATLDCEETKLRLADAFPKWAAIIADGSGYKSLGDYLYATPPIRSGFYTRYLRLIKEVEAGTHSRNLENYLIADRAYDCIQMAQGREPKSAFEKDVETRFERLYSHRLRQNLVGLAHRELKQRPFSG